MLRHESWKRWVMPFRGDDGKYENRIVLFSCRDGHNDMPYVVTVPLRGRPVAESLEAPVDTDAPDIVAMAVAVASDESDSKFTICEQAPADDDILREVWEAYERGARS